MRFVYFIIINYNKRTQGTALAWREGLRRPLASKVLRLLLKPFQKVLNSRPDAQTAELFGITQKPHPLRISRTPAEHPATPGRFPAGFCMRENCLRHGAFTLAHSLCHTSTALFVIFFNLTPSLQHIPSVTRQQLFSLYSSTSRLHYSLPLLRTSAGEVPSGLGWLCRRGALLRRWESALLEKIQLFERRRSEFWIFFSGFSRFPAS